MIGTAELQEAIDKVILGEKLERKPRREELRRVAIHETGHALISETVRPHSVGTVTVAPRGKALGFMRPNGKDQRFLYTKADLEDQIAVLLGGAIAEELIYGTRSTGASNDLEQTVKLAKEIINNGLSPLGIVDEEYTPKERINADFYGDHYNAGGTGQRDPDGKTFPPQTRGRTAFERRRNSPGPSSGLY